MLRNLVVWGMRLGAVLVVVAAPLAARAQDRTTEDRLDRIERDLNMLQRQVYRGAPAAMSAQGGGAAGGTTAADIEIRMERLEAQMRDLTGKVEQVGNGLDQLKQRIEQINSDFDVRVGQMGGAASPAGPPSRSPPADQRFAGAGPPPAAMPPGTVVPPPLGGGGGGLNPIFNTLSPPGSAPPRPPAAEPANGAPSPATGSVNEQFNHAFGLVKQADYAGAETALRSFIEAHPSDPLAGNAHYWLGQTYYARNKFPEAAAAFADGYKRFPKGAKAPDDLLYLGMSLAKADQKKNACLALAQLSEAFPNPPAAVRDRAASEKKHLGCG